MIDFSIEKLAVRVGFGTYGTRLQEPAVPGMEAVMTVRLELKPDIEANLAAQARARGVALDAYLQGMIEDLARAKAGPAALRQRIEATLNRQAGMGRDLPHLPSSAFSRESIYRDHD